MDGLLLLDKPSGVSSHAVVLGVRRRLGGARTGHAGTLDPFATGLLLVLVGRATRTARYFSALPKTYRVGARLGALSTTGDPEGEIVATGRIPDPEARLPTGSLRQTPPAYSAVHVNGERAYRRARRGESFQLPQRTIAVHRFERLSQSDDHAEYEIECSAGTYVRGLVGDLGDAYCDSLRRTRVGPFDLADAVLPGRVAAEHLLSLDVCLSFLERVALDGEAVRRVSHGALVPAPAHSALGAGPFLAADSDGAIAICALRAGRSGLALRPVVGLRG